MNAIDLHRAGHFADFGMDTVSLAGSLEAKLHAIQAAGFSQVMLAARDVVGHPGGLDAAVAAVKASGLRVTGFQVLRDFEGLSGHQHHYKVEIAKQMILMAKAVGAKLLLACCSTSPHASGDTELIAKDLRKLAMLALPHGIKVAFEALSWGRHINEVHQAWEVVEQADCPNLGLGIDSYHILATNTSLKALDWVEVDKIYLVQLADFMWQEIRTDQERMDTARHLRVFPGEGVHSAAIVSLLSKLDQMGYRGDYSLEVFNDDYTQLPLPFVAQRARESAVWLAEGVLRRGTPLPGQMRLRTSR
jgi:sugar phosphate isomerase/epimerase